MSCQVITTRDGGRAVLDVATGEVMHPIVGALAESRDLYVVPSRLEERLADTSTTDPLVLFDVGLGAGTNAVMALRVSEAMPQGARPLIIVSFDHRVDALELALQSDHAADFALDGAVGMLAKRLLDAGEAKTARTTWRLVKGELPRSLGLEPSILADVVFWDPFSPKSTPDLWNVAAFSKLRRACKLGATVHTYSSATASRAAMLLAGFSVGRGSTTGDRETTVAAVSQKDLTEPLGARWFARLARSSAPFPPDAAADALDKIRTLPQFCVRTDGP